MEGKRTADAWYRAIFENSPQGIIFLIHRISRYARSTPHSLISSITSRKNCAEEILPRFLSIKKRRDDLFQGFARGKKSAVLRPGLKQKMVQVADWTFSGRLSMIRQRVVQQPSLIPVTYQSEQLTTSLCTTNGSAKTFRPVYSW